MPPAVKLKEERRKFARDGSEVIFRDRRVSDYQNVFTDKFGHNKMQIN
jgi:hypothetical protein